MTMPSLDQPMPTPSNRRPRWQWIAGGAAVLVVAVAAGVAAAASGDPEPEAAPAPSKSRSGVYFYDCDEVRASGTTILYAGQPGYRAALDKDLDGIACDEGADSPHVIPSPTAAAALAQQPISVDCALDPDFEQSQIFTITFDSKGRPNFSTLWNSTPLSCEIDATVNPVTAIEEKAYKTSRYDDNDIAILYTICAEVDPDDPYVEPGFAASSEQIPEMNGALVLCPNHPQSGKWRQAIKRGQGDVELEAEGRLFYAGTFIVGKEIKPGTYVTTDVEDCYWERQNRNGDTIDNDFIVSARRVQVTIRSTDYAFHSEGCGEWRPA